MSKSINLDGNTLREIAHRTPTATVVATSLATRDRIRHDSDIDRTRSQLIREGESIVEADYIEFWKNLEATGVGSIIYANMRNSKQKPTRFKWHYSLKAVGKAMLEGGEFHAQRVSGAEAQPAPKQAQPAPKPVEENNEAFALKTMLFLENNRKAEIKIPDNFSLKDAEQIYDALKTLVE